MRRSGDFWDFLDMPVEGSLFLVVVACLLIAGRRPFGEIVGAIIGTPPEDTRFFSWVVVALGGLAAACGILALIA